MLMQEPTQEMIEKWKIIYNQHKDKLIPNKKKGMEVVKYLENNYPVIELKDEKLRKVIFANITENEPSAIKLNGVNPTIRIFKIENIDNGKGLYLKQDDIFKGLEIVVGIELGTSYIFVEGSSYLYDELFYFTGLDEQDIKNYFLVAQYIECLEKFKTK